MRVGSRTFIWRGAELNTIKTLGAYCTDTLCLKCEQNIHYVTESLSKGSDVSKAILQLE